MFPFVTLAVAVFNSSRRGSSSSIPGEDSISALCINNIQSIPNSHVLGREHSI